MTESIIGRVLYPCEHEIPFFREPKRYDAIPESENVYLAESGELVHGNWIKERIT